MHSTYFDLICRVQIDTTVYQGTVNVCHHRTDVSRGVRRLVELETINGTLLKSNARTSEPSTNDMEQSEKDITRDYVRAPYCSAHFNAQ